MSESKKMLYEPLDLDLIGNIANVYERAKNSIKYLTDFCASIEARVIDGEEITGLKVIPGNKTRYITLLGEKVLEKNFGDKIYTKKIVGITELEKIVGREKMDEFVELGIIDFKESSPKVIVVDK